MLTCPPKYQHNVLIDQNGVALLADFGRSKLLDQRGFTTSFQGSSRYIAPELMAHEPELGDSPIDDTNTPSDDEVIPNLTKQTDIYAFAMVVIEVC